MKHKISFFALTFGLAVTAMSSRLMAQDCTVAVPFAYEVGSAHMAPGRTVITMVGNQKAVMNLTNSDTGRSVFAGILQPTGNQSSPRLVFHRYGHRYFLVEAALTSGGYQLPVSKAEKEYALSAQAGKPEVVYLAVR